METLVYTNLPYQRQQLSLPIYPSGIGHYTLKKGWTADESRELSDQVSILWFEQGEMEVTYYGQKHLLTTNDVQIILPEEQRCRTVVSDFCEYRWLTFRGQNAAGHVLSYGYDRIIRNADPCPVELFQKISRNLSDTDPFIQRMIVSWIDQILAFAGGRHDPRIHSGLYAKRAKEIIETQYNNSEININTISDMLGCDRSTLTRLFKQEMNRCPGEYLMSIRIMNAGTLLRGSDIPVSEVAKRCGIPNLNNFCRFFKRISGMTPLEFRRKKGVD